MNEIEVKIFDIDVKKVRSRLKELGAEKVGESDVEVAMFDFPDKRITKNDEVLRVRKMHGKVEFVYKEKLEGDKAFKSLNEHQTNVDDFDITVKILEKVGLEVFRHFEKKRTSYKVKKDGKTFVVEFDTIPGVPTYIEIEAQDEETVKFAVKLLGFTMDQTSNMGVHEVWEKYYKGKKEVRFADYENK